MEVLITYLSLDIQRRKISNVRVLPLQFWRELEHLQQTDAEWDRLHYPELSNAIALVEQGFELAFILSDQSRANPMGSHWTACVINLPRREYRFGDSYDGDPPPSLQPRLELWLHWAEVLGPNDHLHRSQDLEHNSQKDGYSCGFIALNMLEHYILRRGTKLWDEESNATLRTIKYINLLEFNGIDRGSPVRYSVSPKGDSPTWTSLIPLSLVAFAAIKRTGPRSAKSVIGFLYRVSFNSEVTGKLPISGRRECLLHYLLLFVPFSSNQSSGGYCGQLVNDP